MKEYAIVVVLYNELPQDYIYKQDNALVIVVDNTPDRDLKLSHKNLIYISNKDNLGIATALNIGFETAINNGVKWVLTLDQDSILPENMLESFIQYSEICGTDVGLIAPVLRLYTGQKYKSSHSVEDINIALQSGSFINTDAYKIVGGFNDQLFIDYVDTEFCWKLLSHNYRVLQLMDVIMQHYLGETKEYKFAGKHLFYVTNHNYIRHYYMMRNSLVVCNAYPKQSKGGKKIFSKSTAILLLKVLVFEKDRIRKIKAIYYGALDYKNNHLGKFDRQI